MKTVGLIGGIGPESTIEYYRQIIAAYREQNGAGNYPAIIVNSIDLTKFLGMVAMNQTQTVTDYLVLEVNKLAQAGVDFGAFASNTPHLVFDEIRARSPIPLVSIVEATSEKARELEMRRVGLFGTRFTMQAHFYPEVFARAGIEIVVPNKAEQTYIHDKYLGELLNNIFLPETREGLLRIADQLHERDGIDGLILGGTELPLLLREAGHNGIPFLDTTSIHVSRIIAELLV